jgi:hypothetical protein
MKIIRCQVIYKEGSMIQWLHRYLFNGLGILMLIGVITGLVLAVISRQ